MVPDVTEIFDKLVFHSSVHSSSLEERNCIPDSGFLVVGCWRLTECPSETVTDDIAAGMAILNGTKSVSVEISVCLNHCFL
jgi:hypothetical protein